MSYKTIYIIAFSMLRLPDVIIVLANSAELRTHVYVFGIIVLL